MHITFDLETLGNSHNAPIVQIGAVKFNEEGKILDKFIRTVEPESIQNLDFTPTYQTIFWWFNQDYRAIQSVFGRHITKVSLTKAMDDFISWVGEDYDSPVWSHATFDPPILKNNLEKAGFKSPFHYRSYKDIRTLTLFTGKIEVERQGFKHNALHDAIFQAKYISKGIKALNKFKETKMKYINT